MPPLLLGGFVIDYKILYEQELKRNEQLLERYNTAMLEKARAERKSLDVINEYEGIILELNQIHTEYKESLEDLKEKEADCEYMRRALIIIMEEIKKMDPHKIGVDIDIE